MAELKKQLTVITEYTDVKEIKHKVEHHIVSNKDDNDKERIFEELFNALTRPVKPNKRVPA